MYWVAVILIFYHVLQNIQLVREKGLEPSHLAAHAPKACVSTIPPLARDSHHTKIIVVRLSLLTINFSIKEELGIAIVFIGQ